jgi:hypothetical protein
MHLNLTNYLTDSGIPLNDTVDCSASDKPAVNDEYWKSFYNPKKCKPDKQHRRDTSDYKGFSFEMKVKAEIEAIPNITYDSNPSNYNAWLSENQKNKYDGTITLPNGRKITLEMKCRDCPKVYHSWFVQCWDNKEADWIITNNTQVISYRDKRQIEAKGQNLYSETEAIVEIGRLVRNILYLRKYLYFVGLIQHLQVACISIPRQIIAKLTNFRDKIRLKIGKRAFIFTIKSRFSAYNFKHYTSLLIHTRLGHFS